ncbi:hypothetical protein BJP36_37835 [Moorena producens JHB]|uniref:Uncharacterized protein n=1 Tax=Moorena producens (strain JHB) TaxID=1454205 RepID=A0A9Q9UWH1_MOOP1|nr:hypothetical protein [Moorena producens]WAN69858.1 hypothetical protein BJP36_37835 [Moorena producens JHB]
MYIIRIKCDRTSAEAEAFGPRFANASSRSGSMLTHCIECHTRLCDRFRACAIASSAIQYHRSAIS